MLSSNGATLDWATYYGGTDLDVVEGVARNAAGDVVLFGETVSTDIPLPNAMDSTLTRDGLSDSVLARITDVGTALAYATLVGESSST